MPARTRPAALRSKVVPPSIAGPKPWEEAGQDRSQAPDTVAALLTLGEQLRRKRDIGLAAARHANLAAARVSNAEDPGRQAWLRSCTVEEDANAAVLTLIGEIVDIAATTPGEVCAKLCALRCFLPNPDDRKADPEQIAIAIAVIEAICLLDGLEAASAPRAPRLPTAPKATPPASGKGRAQAIGAQPA
jgi:hypothetical protein